MYAHAANLAQAINDSDLAPQFCRLDGSGFAGGTTANNNDIILLHCFCSSWWLIFCQTGRGRNNPSDFHYIVFYFVTVKAIRSRWRQQSWYQVFKVAPLCEIITSISPTAKQLCSIYC